MAQPITLIISGPTGVGKSAIAEQLAAQFAGEIVNSDVGQLYAPLSIGTAKPDLSQVSVPHHLFDYLTEPRDFSVAAYRDVALPTIAAVGSRDHIPCVVGGSLFYVRSLFYSAFPDVQMSEAASSRLESDDQLWHTLNTIDPLRAQQIHPHDVYRLKRALAIWEQSGLLPSECAPHYAPFSHVYFLFLTRERDTLYHRIDARVKAMFAAGWQQEVAALDPVWHRFLKRKGLIGYPAIIEYLHTPSDSRNFEDLIADIQKRTRNYAKRQLTFWRSFKRMLEASHNQYRSEQPHGYQLHINDFTLTNGADAESIEQIYNDISKWMQAI